MKNILFLINSYRLGGAEKLAYDIVQGLNEYKDINVYLCSMGSITNELEKKNIKILERKRIHCLSLNKGVGKQRVKVIINLNRIIKKYSIDIIHTNGQSPDFYSRILKMFNNKIQIVTTLHNSQGYSRLIEFIQQRYTDIYTAVSKEVFQYAKRDLKINKKIHIIENGINIKDYLNITSYQTPIILSVGRINEQKDYMYAASLVSPFLRHHKDYSWFIYGDYDENDSYYNKFINYLEELKIRDQVKLKGVCTSPKEIYKQGCCFLLTSKYEGFGIAYIEAMAANLVVLGRNVGCLKDIKNAGGFFINVDEDNVLEVLNEIHNDRECFSKEKTKNYEIITKKYSIDSIVSKYHYLYCNIKDE